MIKKLFYDIRYFRFNSALLRRLLSIYYKEGNTYRILTGSLRNMRIQYDYSVDYHAMLGLSEAESFKLLSRIINHVQSNDDPLVICDIGANMGLYSLWFSNHTAQTSIIYAFEPAVDTVAKLKNNLYLNNIDNVTVIEKACADQVGETPFYLGVNHHSTSSFDAKWASEGNEKTKEVIVSTTSLDYFFYGDILRPGPDFIKMDIEGGGTVALKGCEQVIIKKRPLFLIESHTPDEDCAISELLLAHNYDAFRLNTQQWVQQKDKTYPESKGVWGTMLLCPIGSEIASIIA